MALIQIRDPKQDKIKAGTLAITTASGFAAVIVALATGIDPVFEAVFGKDVSDQELVGEKTAILIAVIAGWVVVAAVDLIVRAYTSVKGAAPREADDDPQDAERQDKASQEVEGQGAIAPMPVSLTATLTRGQDQPGYRVTAVRFDPTETADEDKTRFLIVGAGKSPEWVSGSDLKFE